MQLRRSYLEVSHQLENAHEEVRGLSLRLQENVSYLHLLSLSLCLSALGCFVTKKKEKKREKHVVPVRQSLLIISVFLSILFISYGYGAYLKQNKKHKQNENSSLYVKKKKTISNTYYLLNA